MAYSLILLIVLYAGLATALLARQRSLSAWLVAAYAASAVLVTAAYVILGTTADRALAETGALLVVVVGSWSYLVLLPLTLTGLYFDGWLRLHGRRLMLAIELALLGLTAALLWWLSRSPIVYSIAPHGWIPWPLGQAAWSWQLAAAAVLLSQVVYIVPVGAAVHYRRITLWRGAVPLVLATVLSTLVPVLAPLAGARAWVTVLGLGFVPPVVLLAVLVVRSARRVTLDALVRTSLRVQSNGIILLDGDHRVIWRNVPLMRWLDGAAGDSVTPPHVTELLRGSPLLPVVRQMLEAELAVAECRVVLSDEEYVLQISRQHLANLDQLPGAQLLSFRDITAAHVRRDLDERREELLALSAMSANIASSLDEAQVIERALEQVVNVTRAHGVAIYLRDGAAFTLAGSRHAEQLPVPLPASLSLTDSAAARAVAQQTTLLAPDAQREPGGLASWQGAATVPLLTRDQALGVLQIGYTRAHAFDGVEVAKLESVARQLAVAIDNARLHTQERQQRRVAEVLRAVANIIASQTVDDALQATLVQLAEILDFERATVLLLAEPGRLRIAAHRGLEDPPESISAVRVDIAAYPYLVELFAERTAQIVPDTHHDSRWVAPAYPYRSWMGIPLVTRERMLGCLSIASMEPGRFDDAALQLARTFADQAVIAVENAQLFATEQRRRQQAEQLQQATYEMVTSPDLDRALAASLEGLSRTVTFDRAHVALTDPKLSTWTFRAIYPASTTLVLNQPEPLTDYPLAQQVIAEKRGRLVDDTEQEAGWRPDAPGRECVRSWIGVPLIVRGSVIGLLNADSFRAHAFGEDDLQILQAFGNQTAAVLENFRLLDEAGRQNRALQALNSILAASNQAIGHENLVVVALERLLAALSLPGGVIHRLDGPARMLRLWAASGVPAALSRQLERVPLTGDLLSFSLPSHAQPADGHTFFSVPLVSHGEALGLLSIRERADAPLNAELRDLLRNIGQQLGVVMDNAILFEQTVRRVGLSTDLGRLSLAISAHLNQDAVLELICRESISIFDVQGAYVWLLQEDKLVGMAAFGPGAERFPGHEIALAETTLLPAAVIAEWRPRYVNHVAETAALPPSLLALTQAQAALAVPLVKADVALGTLLLVHTQDANAFAAWSTEQIGLLGVQAALALQNASLFDEVRRRFDQLRLVNEVGRYATSILSPSVLVEGVARKLFSILHYDRISLLQMEDGSLHLHSAFLHGEPISTVADAAHFTGPASVACEAVRQAEPMLRNQECTFVTSEETPAAEQCTSLAVPLIIADEVIGALLVERGGHNRIGQDDLDVLEPLAAQLAISVSNALLYERVRKQTVELEARVAQRTAEIRQQHERTEAILRSVADAVIVFDLHGKVVMTNPVARELFEQHDLDMDLSGHVEHLLTVALDAPTADGQRDHTAIIETGSVALQAKAARVVGGEKVLGSVVVLRDISRLKEVDRMKDQFVSNVSHELRTPLANLKIYLSLLEQGRPERRATYMDVMAREVERLERLIEDLLHISRLQDEQRAEVSRRRSRVNMDRLIDTVVANNAAWAESEQKTLRRERLAQPLPAISANEDQVVRALTNLIANAISYTGPQGEIVVRSRVEPAQQGQPEWVIIEVADTGIGIPSGEVGSIFERFYRGSNVSPSVPGTGLGLAIIRDIVSLHHGEVSVESEEGRGSTFRLKFPAYERSQ